MFKAILWTAILVCAIYAGFKIVPAYAAEYQLSEKMQEEARFAVVNRFPEEKIRDTIFKTVQDLEIPATRDQIKVTSTDQLVRISVDYSVPVDLTVYHTELHFSPTSENHSLF